jgi:hypothetical protein
MVGSTRNRDFNDPSVQNQGGGKHGGASNQAGASQHFDIETEFCKLQQLVQAQAKEIAALKKKEHQRKGKERVRNTYPEWREPTRHLYPLGANKPGNRLGISNIWRRTSRTSVILTILSLPGSCRMLYLTDSSLRRN